MTQQGWIPKDWRMGVQIEEAKKPWYQSALSAIQFPFEQIKKYVEEPVSSALWSGATPPVPGTENLPWFEREKEEYQAWEAPWGVKGATELLSSAPLYALGGGAVVKGIGAAAKGLGAGAKAVSPLASSPAIQKVGKLLDHIQEQNVDIRALIRETQGAKWGSAEEILAGGKGEEAFRLLGESLKGKTLTNLKIPRALLPTKAEYYEVVEAIRTAGFSPAERFTAATALKKIVKEKVRAFPSEEEMLRRMFGEEFLKKTTLMGKVGSEVVSAMNLPRAILASFDFSAPLRQGALLFYGHPIKSLKAFSPMFKAFGSEKFAADAMASIRSSKYFELGKKAGLDITELSGKLGSKEEAFMSGLTKFIPGVRHSERAYVVYLNKIRQDMFETMAQRVMEKGGKLSELKQVAEFLNNASGRGRLPNVGSLKALNEAMPFFNNIFFSPRLQVARVMIAKSMFNSTTRPEAMRAIGSFVGTNTAILTMMQKSGMATVETDMRSSDFGKVKIGNTRLDPWGGFQQYAKLIARMTSGETKTSLEEIRKVSSLDQLSQFGRTKLSPITGLVFDILDKETLIGEEMSLEPESVRQQVYNRLTPLFIQDMIDALETEGFPKGLLAAPGVFGVGVATYKTKPAKPTQSGWRKYSNRPSTTPNVRAGWRKYSK